MPLMNTLGALVSAKTGGNTLPSGLGFVASSSDFDALNWSGTTFTANSIVSSTVLLNGSGDVYIPYRIPASAGTGDNSQGVVAKLSSTGSQLVGAGARDGRLVGTSRLPVNFFGCAFDSSGNIYSAGMGIRIDGSNIYEQALVCKSNTSGSLVWSYIYYSGTGTTPSIAMDIKIDASDNIYVLTNTNTLFKLDTNGNLVWIRAVGGTSPVTRSMALDSFGNIILTSGGTSSSLVQKIDSSGTLVWSKSINITTIRDVAWVNNIIYVATTNGLLTFDNSGTLLHQVSLGITVNTPRISADSSGNIYWGGQSSSNISVLSIDSSMIARWSRIITVNPGTTYPDPPYLSGIGIYNTSMYVVFNQYSDLITSGEIRSMYALKVPTDGKILSPGKYILSDNVITYTAGSPISITNTTFTVTTSGTVAPTTLTRASIPLSISGPSDWYDRLI